MHIDLTRQGTFKYLEEQEAARKEKKKNTIYKKPENADDKEKGTDKALMA